ncbi:MAG TPA: hypothetical protein PKA64_02870 [Myxococcota bacterium]|nr:hypothetical protein [Myxococcota bacterium]
MSDRPLPPALPHGPLTEVFTDVFLVAGAARIAAPVTILGSRNMVVVRTGRSLTLINTLRMDDAGLAALDALGRVEHVVRLAGFHGSDDPFYKQRYGATVWAVPGHAYATGFDVSPPPEKHYFHADRLLGDELPVRGRLYTFRSCPNGEGLLLLDREGGVLISGDALQNWAEPDAYFNLIGRLAFRALGFLKPYNVGPGWLRQLKPDPEELRGVLALPFEHVLPAHGAPAIGGARERFRPAIERAAAWAERARR